MIRAWRKPNMLELYIRYCRGEMSVAKSLSTIKDEIFSKRYPNRVVKSIKKLAF
jgi:lambda repressor-like predicted transcriptional regulator